MQPNQANAKMVRLVIVATVIFYLVHSSFIETQIVSHELRRIATSSNQFGIDALKALDRIEPPDKVLVFCPVCMSSSLIMIMMGSSRYQVVSALRHALYVWSLKPQEINRGFHDVLSHIGLNQHNGASEASTSQESREVASSNLELVKHKRVLKKDYFESIVSIPKSQLSLSNLIKIKESLDKAMKTEATFRWSPIPIDLTNTSGESKEFAKSNLNRTNSVTTHLSSSPSRSQINNSSFRQEVSSDDVRLSATSNIYIQRGFPMNHNYNLLLKHYYMTSIHPLDFIRKAEETRQHINSLVAVSTQGKIKDLIEKDIFNTSIKSSVMIISTFRFRGILDIQIKKEDFNISNMSQAMNSSQLKNSNHRNRKENLTHIKTGGTLVKHGVFPDMSCSVVEIPFDNRLVSFVIVMPLQTNSTELLLTKLNAKVFNDIIGALKVKRLSIDIPVIEFARGPINFSGLLAELGLGTLFFKDKPFTSETGLNRWMCPADMIHETSIDIGAAGWAQPEDRLKVGAHESKSIDNNQEKAMHSDLNHITIEKPFLYFILDSINGLILTMGRIR